MLSKLSVIISFKRGPPTSESLMFILIFGAEVKVFLSSGLVDESIRSVP